MSEVIEFGERNVVPPPSKIMAEGVGFEPTEPESSAVFKTTALDRSAIPPLIMVAEPIATQEIDLEVNGGEESEFFEEGKVEETDGTVLVFGDV